MSNSYVETSFVIPTKTDEQVEFITKTLEGICKIQAGDGGPTDWIPAECIASAKNRSYDFEDAITPDWDVLGHGIAIWYENIDIDLMIIIIQAYLTEFFPNCCFGFTYATYPDPCGGGAVYITAKTATIHVCEDWLDDQFSEVRQGGGKVLR